MDDLDYGCICGFRQSGADEKEAWEAADGHRARARDWRLPTTPQPHATPHSYRYTRHPAPMSDLTPDLHLWTHGISVLGPTDGHKTQRARNTYSIARYI